MAYFYSTPIGKILKRYSRDMDLVDIVLSMSVWHLLQRATTLFFQVAVVWYFAGVAGIFVAVIAVFALKTMFPVREYQRLEGSDDHEAGRLNFISEALDGAPTIRAFGPSHVERFRIKHGVCSDTFIHTCCCFCFLREYFAQCFNIFVVIRFTHIYGTLLAFLGLLLWKYQFPPAVSGLLLHYIFMIEGNIMGVATGFLNSLFSMSSVQRICEFSSIEPESTAHTLQTVQAPVGWPARGHIVFNNVYFDYPPKSESIVHSR